MDYENEEWRDVGGYEGLYQVSNTGRVKRLGRINESGHNLKEKILKAGRSAGYPHVSLYKNKIGVSKKVHALVAAEFLGERPTPETQCNHKNGDRTDNRIENLEYCTPQENSLHAYRVLGKFHNPLTIPRGEKHERAKLTEGDVLAIRRICDGGNYSPKELGERYGVHPSLIYRIDKRLIWRHLL